MATLTRNQHLADLAAVAHKVMERYPNLPSVAGVSLSETPFTSRRPMWVYAVQLQLGGLDDMVNHLAQWAIEFGSPVLFAESPANVRVSTEAVVDGQVVLAWTALEYSEAWRLALALELKSLSDMAEVEPARLLMMGGEQT